MGDTEVRIREFLKERQVPVFGMAGPERLSGPPSLNPGYLLPGARSVISLVLPMDIGAIHDFLSKKTPVPHNLDQLETYQRIQRVSHELAGFLRALGFAARAASPSADYRRSPYVFSTRPEFSHRLGAVASGAGALGWSGNLMTRRFGAAIVLNTVVTDAVLASDPLVPGDHFIENFCKSCRQCVLVCPSRMFEARNRETILAGGRPLTRASRRSLDLCHISCFGLHSLSPDKKWTNWGLHWINNWIDGPPNPGSRLGMVRTLLRHGLATGDATPRFFALEKICRRVWPEKTFSSIPGFDRLPDDPDRQYAILSGFLARVGVRGMGAFPVPMVCGHCALVCAPTVAETKQRARLLVSSGLVVPGKNGRMTRVRTFEEARALKKKHPLKPGPAKILSDAAASLLLWHAHYFGFEPKAMVQNALYRRKAARALKK